MDIQQEPAPKAASYRNLFCTRGYIWAEIYFENRNFHYLGEEICHVIDGTSFFAFLKECEAVAMTSFYYILLSRAVSLDST